MKDMAGTVADQDRYPEMWCTGVFELRSPLDGEAIKVASMVDELEFISYVSQRVCADCVGTSFIPPSALRNNEHTRS